MFSGAFSMGWCPRERGIHVSRNSRYSIVPLLLLTALTAGVCLAGTPFFSDAPQYAAIAKTVSGDVSLLRESQKWAVIVGSKIQPKDTVVTGPDGNATFEIADGSTIQVYPNSRFLFRNNPPNWRDLLDLFLGDVKIHIEHLNGKPNPHRIHTPTAVASVRGTTLHISVDADETTLVEVDEGLVEVRHLLLPNGVVREVRGGEAIRVYRDEPIARGSSKGEIFRRALRIGMDAIVIAGRPGAGGGGSIPGTGGGGIPGGGGGGPVGDTDPGSIPPATGGPGSPPTSTGPPATGGPGLPPPTGGPGALPPIQ